MIFVRVVLGKSIKSAMVKNTTLRHRLFTRWIVGGLVFLALGSCHKEPRIEGLKYVPQTANWVVHLSVSQFLKNQYGPEIMQALSGKLRALQQWKKASVPCVDFEKEVQQFLLAGQKQEQYFVQLEGRFNIATLYTCLSGQKITKAKVLSSGSRLYEINKSTIYGTPIWLFAHPNTPEQFADKIIISSLEWSQEVSALVNEHSNHSLLENARFRSVLLDTKSGQNEFFSAMFDGPSNKQIFEHSVLGMLGHIFAESENVSIRIAGLTETRFRFVTMYGSNMHTAQDIKRKLDTWQKEIWLPLPKELAFMRSHLKIALNGSTIVGEAPILSSGFLPWHLYFYHL